jgi:membrane protein implicated in regulation of membrane protease activity
MIYGWFWLALIFLSTLITILTAKNFYAAFAVGSVTPVILDILGVSIIWQFVAFVVTFFVFLAVMAKFFADADDNSGAGISYLVGKKCIVDEEIDNSAGRGQVKINGQAWAARSVSDEKYEVGKTLVIVAVEGVQLICRS